MAACRRPGCRRFNVRDKLCKRKKVASVVDLFIAVDADAELPHVPTHD
jgi:hypothetical protein